MSAVVSGSRWQWAVRLILLVWAGRILVLGYGYFVGGLEVRRHHLETAFFWLIGVCLVNILLNRSPSAATNGVPVSPQSRFARVWLLLAALLAAFLLYRPALCLGLLSDDFVLARRAHLGQFVPDARNEFVRPVPLLIWRVIWKSVDEPGFALHVLNTALHGVNAWMVALLAQRWGLTSLSAVAAAGIFLSFPIHPEAVAWASGIQDVLMTTFSLAAVLTHAATSSQSGSLIMSLLIAAALGTKETAVVAPVLIALTWRQGSSHSPADRRMAGLVLVFGFVAAYVAWRLVHGIPTTYWQPVTRYTLKELIARPFATLGLPVRQRIVSSTPSVGLGSMASIVALVLAASWTWRWHDPGFQRAIRMTTWILVSVLPVYSFFEVTNDLQGSRFLYLAVVGWAILLATLLERVSPRPPDRACNPIFVSVAAAVMALSVVGVRSELAIWEGAAEIRDRVFLDAARVLRETGCSAARFENLPDSHRGAYVFRNGFSEALLARGLVSNPEGRIQRGCRFMWSGSTFERLSP